MGYADGDTKPSAWEKMLRVGAFIVAAGVAKAVISFGVQEYRVRTFDPDAAVAKLSTDKPELGELFDNLRTSFPDDYAKLMAGLKEKVIARAPGTEVGAYGSRFMHDFTQRHKADLAQAPSLDEFRTVQVAALNALHDSDQTLCAHFVMTGLRPYDVPGPAAATVLAQAGSVQLRAIVAGARTPANRSTADISDNDSVALVKKMQALGLTDEQLKLFASESGMAGASEHEQCEIGAKLLKAAADLPAAQADRVSAFLITHS